MTTTTDELIADLRAAIEHEAGTSTCYEHMTSAADRLEAQALRIAELADEVEMWKATANAVVDFEKAQLRAELDKAKLHIKHIGNDALRTESHELRAELDALKAQEPRGSWAIDEIANAKPTQPLTDDDIDAIGVDYRGDYRKLREFARAIEAHIKGQA
jgi:hypothetical protein